MTRDEVINGLEAASEMLEDEGYMFASMWVNDAITLLETESTRGLWEPKERVDAWDVAGNKTWAQKRQCTNCGFIHYFIEDHMHYVFCPSCGALMRKEETSNDND